MKIVKALVNSGFTTCSTKRTVCTCVNQQGLFAVGTEV